MKTAIVIFFAILLSACSSFGVKTESKTETPAPYASASLQGSSGTLNLTFDKSGNWVSISTLGTATLSNESASSHENALMVATMRAKRTLAEFLSNDIKSSKSQTRIAKEYSRTFLAAESQPENKSGDKAANEDSESILISQEDGSPVRTERNKQANQITTALTEQISDSSAAILKGAYVSERKFNENKVIVELTTSKASIDVAKNIARMMQGSM